MENKERLKDVEPAIPENNLANLNINIGEKLLETINILEIMDDIIEGETKTSTLLKIVKNNIISSFNDIELCRKMICDFE